MIKPFMEIIVAIYVEAPRFLRGGTESETWEDEEEIDENGNFGNHDFYI